MLVARDDLAIANSRLLTGMITFNQLAGPPLGAALFVVGSAWPFGAEALVIGLGVVLVSRVVLPPHAGAERRETHLRQDIIEGFRWVIHHPAVRTLVLTIFIFNITFGAAWSVLVLYASQRLSLGNIMRVGLIIETLTHLALALTTSPWVAVPVFLVLSAHAFIWGTTSVTIRQRAVPTNLQGRVGSVNMVGTYGGLVIGSGIGGVLAQQYGVTAPFWFAFLGSAVFVIVIWPQLSHIAHEDQRPSF